MNQFYSDLLQKTTVNDTLSSAVSNLFLRSFFLSLGLILLNTHTISAQKPELPLHPDLKNNSKKMKVKLGPKYLNSTFAIKIGDYKMARRKIKRKYADEDKFMGVPMENSQLATFSTILTSKNKDTAYIDVASNITKKETHEIMLFNFFVVREYELIEDSNFSSVFITTSLDKEAHWLLVLSSTGEYEFSASDTYLIKGRTYITAKAIKTEPFGSIMQSSARGIEFYLDNKPLGAFQYTSGGGMGYKQYVWISDQATPEQELALTAAFAAILELMKGARVHYFEN